MFQWVRWLFSQKYGIGIRILSVLYIVSLIFFKRLLIECTGFRPFAVHNISRYSNCSGETALAELGCPCALVGQHCFNTNSLCFGPNGATFGDFGNGTIKRGVCGCQMSSFLIKKINRCEAGFHINITAGLSSPAPIDGCLCSYSTIPGLSIKVRNQGYNNSIHLRYVYDTLIIHLRYVYNTFTICLGQIRNQRIIPYIYDAFRIRLNYLPYVTICFVRLRYV